ncbi:mariner-1 protein [Nephila pilipes]|uniref:Mariner-1 protein n=1 Tax=Nephila pilipes TaxID=299642 RepID=A0A8X6TNG9_NEPPI|nr:mariner-1 protein [Nephila pilipes]
MEIKDIRVLMKYEFHRSATTRLAVANINSVFGIQVATNATVAHRLKTFRSGDFEQSNESRREPKTQVDNDVLKATEEANSSQSARAQIGNVKKLDKWIPHELTDAQKE